MIVSHKIGYSNDLTTVSVEGQRLTIVKDGEKIIDGEYLPAAFFVAMAMCATDGRLESVR